MADHDLMRRTALGLLAFGGALEMIYSVFFKAPDWTDAVAMGLVILAALIVFVLPVDDISERWMLGPLALGLAAVALISIGDGVPIGVPFLFLPSAVTMVFFWHDAVVKSLVLIVVAVIFVGVPILWGSHEAVIEAFATLPLLVTSSILLGLLFNRFRDSTVEEARFRGTITALLMALEAREGHTTEHASAVLTLVTAVSENLGLEPREQLHVADVALLHDIGKIGIPTEILHKPATLDEDEWNVMKRHPEIGERILSEVPGFEAVATAVRHEHERWDGLGYPDGKRGTEIPRASRIVLVCDAYNAMISKRPYRAPLSEAAAREQLLRNAGTQFDPVVVDALLAVLEQNRLGFAHLTPARADAARALADDAERRGVPGDGLLTSFSRRAASL